ncbi:V-type ATP synthase subunit B [Candidatus Bathyarchaeota archaeon]|jgi:V/A-type H+-transporting ATPase subunit B|nr:V-type ATP synthase subunit B [Candidatus Bathyarchaeota archaeon]MDP6048905.1 V-type ATP synthase subunit B [Candidatus Bathyarchaeota archaeon]MDP7444016.1 V-type ATP synthase subunit B [Candidatus Bathyarchaeota archaeon]
METEQSGMIYKTTSEIKGPILMVEGVKGVAFDEIVNIRRPTGEIVTGSVLDVSRDWAMVQCFGDTSGMDLNVQIRFTGETLKIPMSEELIGRVFSGSFQPLDGIPVPLSTDRRDVNGGTINPAARDVPSEFIQTGISAIDGMNSLVRGQKLPIFSESGLPHNVMAAQIARQATIPGQETDFAIVFGAMGIKNEEADYFRAEFEKTGALSKSVLVLNLADDPPIERIVTPRIAQTIAEYLAFDLGMHVLVILTDMTNYAEALRTISIAREEVPTRKGYPGYLYSDLATIYERAGRIQGRPGSVTLMPILSMPAGDKTHPVPDLTGYITEGQLILERELSLRGIYPPMNPLPSLSRLMKDGIGEETTREDHQDVSNQLYMAYAEGTRARGLVRIVGEVGLSDRERTWLRFADRFEQEFVNQGPYENRSIEQTLGVAWDLLSILPEEDLIRIRENYITKYHPAHKSEK